MLARYMRKVYTSLATHVYDIPSRMMALMLLSMFTLLPFIRFEVTLISTLIEANFIAIFAASWDLLVRAGQVSLGHALFYGMGGYTTAFLFKYLGWSIWITIPISMLVNAALALVIGIPCLRLKGPYLALITMAFPLVTLGLIKGPLSSVTGGEIGIYGLPPLFPSELIKSPLDRVKAEYYLTLTLMVFCSIILYKIAYSKTGMVFVSILDDELASKACGINVTKYKLMAFAMSGFFASLAGCIHAHKIRVVNPPMFGITISLIPLIAAVLGGLGTIYGPLVGTYIYYILDRYILTILIPMHKWTFYNIEWGQVKPIIFTLIVIVFIIKWPRGIGRGIVEKLEDLEKPREIEEIEKEKSKKHEKS
jgi:branched-chain amino acid transport system permease protein